MSHAFVTVNWNRRKRIYDLCLWLGIALFIGAFVAVSKMQFQGAHAISMPIILMRAFATCGFLMLTLILCIGPLARIDARFLPLLYNRRHFGVSFFIIALAHAALAIYWYHSFGVLNPLVSVVTSGDGDVGSRYLSFQVFGLVALLIFFLMAATSHDYWNAVLGPVWKTVHLLMYPGYALLVVHIGMGAMRTDNTGLLPIFVFVCVLIVCALHLFAALARSRADKNAAGDGDYLAVCHWREIENNRAVTVSLAGDERVAIFRYDENKLCAVSNVCQHQNGPLGEGRVIDGCITCPWHGYQYRPEDGRSPPPFTEKIETYRLKLEGDMIYLDRRALPKGAAREISVIPNSA